MEDPILRIAYEASRQSLTDDQWISLAVRDRATLIYQEMRRIDAGGAPVSGRSPENTSNDGFGTGA